MNTDKSLLENENEPSCLGAVISCPHCGSLDLDLDENFCNNCTEYID